MIYVGADFGRDDKTAIVVTQRGEDGRLRILHTWEGSGEPPAFFQVSLGGGRQQIVSAEAVQLEWWLRKEHVSPHIIERVLRLNPDGGKRFRRLRGLHRTEPGRRLWTVDAISKGEVIRRFGREVFDRVPRWAYIKRGRRRFATQRDVEMARRSLAERSE